jgi:hypothetical protein
LGDFGNDDISSVDNKTEWKTMKELHLYVGDATYLDINAYLWQGEGTPQDHSNGFSETQDRR